MLSNYSRRGLKFGLLFLLWITTTLPALPSKIPTVLLPGTSPLVTFRILFMTGSAFDPPGKEGPAALTASMLAQGGTRSMSYNQIVQALYPMASSVNAQVDKEMTIFTGTTHIENLDHYYAFAPRYVARSRFSRRRLQALTRRRDQLPESLVT